MSDFFRTNNTESAKELYIKRGFYMEKMLSRYPNLKDFQRAEKYLYGRVSRSYVPIEVHPTTRLGGLPNTNRSDANGFEALEFVADAFHDLVQQFKKKAMSGHIRADDPFLSALDVQRAYISPRTLYRNFQNTNKEEMAAQCRDRSLNFKNFDEFLVHFRALVAQQLTVLPFTYPAFIKSRHCPMHVTGLVIDISKKSCDDDALKVKSFRNSPNWDFYLNACRSYGFSVDVNNPGRLVADLGTREMIQYARKNNYLSTDNVLARAYTPAHRVYYASFKQVLVDIYQAAQRDYVDMEYCADGTTRTRVVYPAQYDMRLINATYPDSLFFKIYMEIRVAEHPELKLDPTEYAILEASVMDIFQERGSMAAVDVLEKALAPTYNNSGSLTDIIRHVIVQKEEAEDVLSNT
tara:strand:- start:4748 stop:5968 length:1221 start_codon:yes stop_codon:yes gene_type:complete